MKKTTPLIIVLLLLALSARPQNADNLYYNSLASGYDYQAASFVIDTALPAYPFNRAMLLWAANAKPPGVLGTLSLDETDNSGIPLTQHVNAQGSVQLRGLQPKRIIRSRFSKHYYLLAYVAGSPNLINGFAVNSSAFVLKLDDNLNLVWSSKIHFAAVTAANAAALIEYNDIIETADRNIVLVGRYARTSTDRQALQLAKLDQATGLNIWWYWYYLWSCHANGLSVIEASNGQLAVTGYAEQCTPPSFTGNRQLLFARVRSDGAPIQFRKFLNPRAFSGDKITRFISSAGAGTDRFFITGFIDVLSPTGATNRQNLVVDISQNGNINRSSHYGDAGSEEVNDHIFSRLALVPNTYELYLTGYTTSYTTNNSAEAYFNILRYNAATLTFSIARYDVLRNVYPGNTVFNSRRGIELKNAGPRRFAILTNCVFTTANPTYNHTYTTVFVRDLTAVDTVCHRPKTPPLVNFVATPRDTAAVWQGPNYAIYPETWTNTPKIPYKPVCGTNWKISPAQAINAFVNPPEEIRADEDNATARSSMQYKAAQHGRLYPNPAGNEVTIQLDKAFAQVPAPITIRLLSPEMKQLRTERTGYRPLHTLSLSGLLPGMYIVELLQGNNRSQYRFVKE